MISRNPGIGPTGGEPLYLDWTEKEKCLETLLSQKYFFRRFTKKEINNCL
jgi:hypothetical protein